MIEKYVYAVTKRLPEGQREDVAEELRGLIEDMLDERTEGGAPSSKDVEEVLIELGHPRSLARKYRGTDKVLIGPELYDLYMLVLKIAFISTGIAIAAVFVIQTVINPPHILEYFVSFIVSIFTTLPMVLGWTTFGFALAEYYSDSRHKLEMLNLDKEWHPSQLSAVPDPNHQIKRCESIAGIVFQVLFIVILAFGNDYLGIWLFEDGQFLNVIPFINDTSSYLLLFVLVFVLGLVKECLKFVYEKWTQQLISINTLINLVSIVLVLLVLSSGDFWNPNFMEELAKYEFLTQGSSEYEIAGKIWEQATLWTLILTVIGLVWDTIVGWFKFRKV